MHNQYYENFVKNKSKEEPSSRHCKTCEDYGFLNPI
jgi:hypothetical protein